MDLQIRVDHLEFSEAEVRMLRMAKGPPSTLGSLVGGLPSRVVQELAQVCEVLSVQVLLLLTERRELSRCGILLPGAVPLLGFRR